MQVGMTTTGMKVALMRIDDLKLQIQIMVSKVIGLLLDIIAKYTTVIDFVDMMLLYLELYRT
jgi:hypothetical protein